MRAVLSVYFGWREERINMMTDTGGVKSRFHGCYVATLTPFDAGGRLDADALEAHCGWLINAGIEGLCPAGTTGEFLFLSVDEKRLVVEHTVNAAAGRVPVLA